MKIAYLVSILLLISIVTGVKHQLDDNFSVEWEILNSRADNSDREVKFTLTLANDKQGWASIGWRLDPVKYPSGMANADYISYTASIIGAALIQLESLQLSNSYQL